MTVASSRESGSVALPPLGRLALATVAYFLAAAASTIAFGTLTPIWYSNAIALAALVSSPVRTWPVFIVSFWMVDTAVVHFFGHGPPALLALCDMLEVVLAATALQLTGGVRTPLFAGAQVARVVLVCLLAPLASAFSAAAVLQWSEGASFSDVWHSWYAASALGLLIALPLLLSWMDPELRTKAFSRFTPTRVLVLSASTLFTASLVTIGHHHAALFFTFPLVFALTWAFGLVGVTAGMLALTVSSLWATLQGQGALVGMLLPVTDVTERIEAMQIYLAALLSSSLPLAVLHSQQKELAISLRTASEARTEFLAAMSHEIRTPMTGVLGMADLLGAEPLTPRQKKYVDAMRSSGRHLLSIINDILDFSRIESGKLELEEIDFSLEDVVQELQSLVHPLAVERGLSLRIDGVPALALRGDPLRIRQVLLNLVSNAIKFTEKGSVVVTLAQQAEPDADGRVRVRFGVRDTGVGIEPDKLAQLFAPFTQADRSISRQYGGSGLGLAISKRLVEAMGGTIGATSTPGQGSDFHFELPLQQGSGVVQKAASAAQSADIPPQRILIAEDVEINREILRTTLQRQGHHLVFAVNGAEAFAFVQQQEFDLVLMDVQMPVMDGVEATRRIRQLPAARGTIPILGLTANVMAREQDRYLNAGMNECLPKPIDWARLSGAIARHARTPAASPPTQARGDPETAPASVPLLDLETLDALRKMANEEELSGLIAMGMKGYAAGCDAMTGATAAEVRMHAHKIRGSSGTLGLQRISDIAARIEEAAEEGRIETALLPELRASISATRDELLRQGLLPA